jgi:acyl carrier protein
MRKERIMTADRIAVRERIFAVIREHFGLEQDHALREETHLFDDMGGDSLDLAEVLMELEDEFKVNAPDEGTPPRKLGEMVDVVLSCLEQARETVEKSC